MTPYVRFKEVNELGHTIFDNLMVAIINSHTNITPDMVDDKLRKKKCFTGEETDICGRWDADSDCVQILYASGADRIPFEWKHKFCHTSAQVICHSIDQLEKSEVAIWERILATPSGLYRKRCVFCLREMQFSPLHTLVMVASGLAEFGTKGEDLFGMVAVLLKMLRAWADPTQVVGLSLTALFPSKDDAVALECDHVEMTPVNLAKSIPHAMWKKWSAIIQQGWKLFCSILSYFSTPQISCNLEPCPHSFIGSFWGWDTNFRVLCSVVETELLIYRRLQERDRWLSSNITMRGLRTALMTGDWSSIDLVNHDFINLSKCGCLDADEDASTGAHAIVKFCFWNLDNPTGATYISAMPGISYVTSRFAS